ncbi:unnamed protein product [Cochlearia groenlandica]
MIDQSGDEIQKLRINLRNVKDKNLQLAQANTHMLALKLLQHELGCKNLLLKTMKITKNENEVISRGENQVNVVVDDKKFVPDATKPLKDIVHNNRQCVQESEQTEKLDEETKETTMPSLRRQSARLRRKEAEPCKSFNEKAKAKEEMIKKRRRSLVSEVETVVSISEAVESSQSIHDTKETNVVKRRLASTETEEAVKEITENPSLCNDIVEEPSTVSQEDKESELKKKKKPKAHETQGMRMRRTSRHAAKKIKSYKEGSLKVKMWSD